MKPNLFIVGAPKCGTTAWVKYLSGHPEIAFGSVKEPHYFSSDFPRMAQVANIDEYLSLFRNNSAKIIGEASVLYLYSEVAARKIYDFNPQSKIIILVRRQEEFLPSFHNQLSLNFQESIEDFNVAWNLSGSRSAQSIPNSCRVDMQLNYKEMGKFWKYSKRYFDIYPRDQIRLIHYDDWTRNTRTVYRGILEFLGLDDDGRTDFPRVNPRSRHRYLSVARFLQQPPPMIERYLEVLHRFFGVRSFGVAPAIEKLNRRIAANPAISSELKDEIRKYYQDENRQLQEFFETTRDLPAATNHIVPGRMARNQRG